MRIPVPILLYHSISVHSMPKFARWVVSPELFEAHMVYLKEAGYQPLTVTEFVGGIKNVINTSPKPVLVTFDDGFADFYTHAVPILERHSMEATIYITTGSVGRTSLWLSSVGEGQREMMSWEQVADLPNHGIECGAHGHSHLQLDILPHAAARQEIIESKNALEKYLNRAVDTFAYPFGYYNSRLISILKQVGFSSASAVRHALSSNEDNPYALARLIISSNTSLPALRLMLAGVNIPVAPYPERAITKAWRGLRWVFSRLNIRAWSSHLYNEEAAE